MTLPLPFFLETSHKIPRGEVPFLCLKERSTLISKDRGASRRILTALLSFPQSLQLPHTASPTIFLHECLLFIKPSIKILRFVFLGIDPVSLIWIVMTFCTYGIFQSDIFCSTCLSSLLPNWLITQNI